MESTVCYAPEEMSTAEGSLGNSQGEAGNKSERGSRLKSVPHLTAQDFVVKQLEDTELFLAREVTSSDLFFQTDQLGLLSRDPLGQEQENWHPHRRSDCHRSHQFSSLLRGVSNADGCRVGSSSK